VISGGMHSHVTHAVFMLTFQAIQSVALPLLRKYAGCGRLHRGQVHQILIRTCLVD